MVLFINACVRSDSRTRRLAEGLLTRLGAYEEVKLTDSALRPLNEEILNKRTERINAGNYDDSMFDYAKQFASADTVVIAAPYWDGSFPSVLKIYFENIYITGLVSRYGADGKPIGLCKADRLFYVTTAGGPYIPTYSYDYIRELAVGCFGIRETRLIQAELLDVDGFDAEKILSDAEREIDRLLCAD